MEYKVPLRRSSLFSLPGRSQPGSDLRAQPRAYQTHKPTAKPAPIRAPKPTPKPIPTRVPKPMGNPHLYTTPLFCKTEYQNISALGAESCSLLVQSQMSPEAPPREIIKSRFSGALQTSPTVSACGTRKAPPAVVSEGFGVEGK